jgi:non-canonical purine NTP pyrophosphatase (RdgB/HAM1 family)
LVEDTSLYLDCLNGLPGPLIKWFLHGLGNEGLYNVCDRMGDFGCEAKTIIGYSDGVDFKFFEGSVRGKIVSPKGDSKFGWEPIFLPEGQDKRYSEMSFGEKNRISMRRIALDKLKEHLDKKV